MSQVSPPSHRGTIRMRDVSHHICGSSSCMRCTLCFVGDLLCRCRAAVAKASSEEVMVWLLRQAQAYLATTHASAESGSSRRWRRHRTPSFATHVRAATAHTSIRSLGSCTMLL